MIARSACGAIVSVSVAELLPVLGSVVPAGGVTVAVFVSVPVAAGLSVPVTTMRTPLPACRFTVRLMLLPVPLGVPQLAFAPLTLAQVQVTLVSAAGTVSVIATPVTSLGPV